MTPTIYVLWDHDYITFIQPAISVRNGYINTTTNNTVFNNGSGNPYVLPSSDSVSLISDANHRDSNMMLRTSGYAYIIGGGGHGYTLQINLNVRINGSLTSNLVPKTLILSYSADGPVKYGGANMQLMPAHLTDKGLVKTMAKNISMNKVAYFPSSREGDTYFWLGGYGVKNGSMTFINDSRSVPVYNFSFSTQLSILVNWHSGNVYDLSIGSYILGLSKTVNSTYDLRIVE